MHMRKDSMVRKLPAVGMAALLCLLLAAAPASAKKRPDKHSADEFSYVATINCGRGPMVVGSGDNTSDPFVVLRTGKRFLPVEWHVRWDGGGFDEVIPNTYRGRRMWCTYDDGFAKGWVLVVKARPEHGRVGDRHDDRYDDDEDDD
jgi:hypothetical protein